MQRRHDVQNIPIELLRSFVVIQESGSFTRAAEALSLTQPAISAQIKRLQQLVGGEVFVRSGFGISLSEKGEIVSRYARRILAMNDQILSLTGTAVASKTIRIGIPSVYASSMLPDLIAACRSATEAERLHFACEASSDLARNLSSGYLDIAFLSSSEVAQAMQIERWSETMCWVCAPSLSTSPGSAIPLQSWPYGVSDQIAIEALENAGLAYSIVFTATDLSAHLAALRSGVGYVILPQRLVPPDLKIAREHFLPALAPCRTGIYVNSEKDTRKLRDVAARLADILRPPVSGHDVGPASQSEMHRSGSGARA
ncbi:MAG: LysR family transcriptional regulator [Pseudorhodoplanes sp.]